MGIVILTMVQDKILVFPWSQVKQLMSWKLEQSIVHDLGSHTGQWRMHIQVYGCLSTHYIWETTTVLCFLKMVT